ncbi:histidine phosphatase family protein [Rubellimicrobium mesophilum]|uniref:histidine phosphatase family protein n=1 Tax=Rubellimicrobium mesophilum TaxID=1123067 RepID=UPI00068578E8|nr:histidine phosphatase family protein [Rubellimicrobium mesophilum]
MTRALPELLLLRHGQTEWNREGRFQGARDSRLTELGCAQAAAMGNVLRELGVGAESYMALTSPQGRARDTARLALGPLGLGAGDDPRLVEIGMGDWTGLTRADIDGRWPGPPDEPLFDFYCRCPGGETFTDLAGRAEEVLAGLDRPTVIVTHGITLRVLCALALGLPVEEGGRLPTRQGSVHRIAGGRMEVLEAHLPEPALAANPIRTGG